MLSEYWYYVQLSFVYFYKEELLGFPGNLNCQSSLKKENRSCKSMRLETDDLEG